MLSLRTLCRGLPAIARLSANATSASSVGTLILASNSRLFGNPFMSIAARSFASEAAETKKEKKAAKKEKAAASDASSASSGSFNVEAFNAPMNVNKEVAVALLDLSEPVLSVVVPKDPLKQYRFGVVGHEERGPLSAKHPRVYLPFPSVKLGDMHLFTHHSASQFSVVVLANLAGLQENERLLPFHNQDDHLLPQQTHAFNRAFQAHYIKGTGSSASPKLAEWEGILKTLKRVQSTLTSSGYQKKSARTIHVHTQSADINYIMSLNNQFDGSSAHPAVALRALVAELNSQFGIAVRFHHGQGSKLRFGERKLVDDWLAVSERIARLHFDITNAITAEKRQVRRQLARVQRLRSEARAIKVENNQAAAAASSADGLVKQTASA